MINRDLSSRLHQQPTMSRTTSQDYSAVAYTAGIMLSTLLAIFLAKLFVKRKQFLQMRRQGLVRISPLAI